MFESSRVEVVADNRPRLFHREVLQAAVSDAERHDDRASDGKPQEDDQCDAGDAHEERDECQGQGCNDVDRRPNGQTLCKKERVSLGLFSRLECRRPFMSHKGFCDEQGIEKFL
jgi:hypothetical protein